MSTNNGSLVHAVKEWLQVIYSARLRYKTQGRLSFPSDALENRHGCCATRVEGNVTIPSSTSSAQTNLRQ